MDFMTSRVNLEKLVGSNPLPKGENGQNITSEQREG